MINILNLFITAVCVIFLIFSEQLMKYVRGNSHIRRTGVLVVAFRGQNGGFGISQGVLPQKVPNGSFVGTFFDLGYRPKKKLYELINVLF